MSSDPESVSLPEPPPPRPAARDAAIEAALRRFEGAEKPTKARRRPTPWTRRPQFQLAMAASLVLAIGLPTALIVLRDQASHPVSMAPAAAPTAQRPGRTDADAATDLAQAEPAPAGNARVPAVAVPPSARQVAVGSAISEIAASPPAQEREEGYAAPAPPPPPPPPQAPAPTLAQKSAEAGANGVVITGTRIPPPNLTSASPVTVLDSRSAERDAIAAKSFAKKDRDYASFLLRLQAAIRDNDPGAVTRLISFPLRVNSGGQSQTYPDARSVRRDFSNIFTPHVREAILSQRADRLFSRDLGVMIGNGEVWFDHVCVDESCSRLGPVRITAINR